MVGTRSVRTRPDITVGRLLAEAREHHGLSLSEASYALHIPVKHLQGLEEGDLSVFPAEIYAKGAFTRYAQYLGIYADGTQRAFQRILSGSREQVPLTVHTPKSWLAARLTPRWILAGAILSVAAVVGLYLSWQVSSFVRLPQLTLQEPVGGIMEDTSLTVTGNAAIDATVSVNGEQVLLGEDGSFATQLILHPGINVVQVEATNAAGRSRLVERHVLVPRS